MSAPGHRYNPPLARERVPSPILPMENVQGLRPGSPVSGAIRVPCSKSLAQRAFVCASLAGGTTRITALDPVPARGADIEDALSLVRAAGAAVESLAPGAVAITGRPPGPHRGWNPGSPVDAGESGTLARFATAALGFCGTAGRSLELRARGTLRGRSSPALMSALRESGVGIEPLEGGTPNGWPVRIVPIGPPSTVRLVAPRSSQEVSALLIALAAYPDTTELVVTRNIPSLPYVQMTMAMLNRFGARIVRTPGEMQDVFEIRGPLFAPDTPLSIEPDASAAAVALAAACLSGGEVFVRGLSPGSSQGDVRIVDHLRAFGCVAGFDDRGVFAHGAPERGASLDLENEPDLAPVLAAVAARVASEGRGRSTLRGLRTLPGKESSRIEVLASALEAVGLVTEWTADALAIDSPRRPLETIAPDAITRLDPRGDHRMAFAFALLGLSFENVVVLEPDCVKKSWPGFWDALRAAGARVIAGGG
jgi:3-phosphoshikimate 1-carboxyvinyltransferase